MLLSGCYYVSGGPALYLNFIRYEALVVLRLVFCWTDPGRWSFAIERGIQFTESVESCVCVLGNF